MKYKVFKAKRRVSALMLALLTAFVFTMRASSAETASVTAPAGTQNYTFSVDLTVNESEAYAGIQFGLTLSDDNAVTFGGFELSAATNGAIPYPENEKDGVHYFGFLTGSNAYQGRQTVGKLTFTYSGGEPQTITITSMLVVRVTDNHVSSDEKASPVYVINVSRAANSGSDVPGGNPSGGGTAGSGSTIEIEIDDEGTALAGLENVNPFEDVFESDWFYNDVLYVYQNGLMMGTSDDPMLFSPQSNTTRAMIVTILYRLDGSPEVSGGDAFSDVEDDMWYSGAIQWGAANGIILGYGDGRFGCGDLITREQFAVILLRYEQYSGKNIPATGELTFTDAESVQDWAKDAVNTLSAQGIINGKPGGLFDPANFATRAEVAAVFHRLLSAM